MLRTRPGAIGVDEAGRGPLAGPVVAAAVQLPPDFPLDGLDDSKRLSARDREALARRIRAAGRWAVAFVDAEEIDRTDILRATFRAMEEAVRALGLTGVPILIDGDRRPPGLPSAECHVRGDATWACIAAASILAKTARDAHMVELARRYPGYGFDEHFGYPTPAHREALARLGPCPCHRRSFASVRRALEQPCLRLTD